MIPRAKEYGKRGGEARAHRHSVSDELVTTAQIAKRLGLALSTVQRRLKARPGPHTWQSLIDA